MAEIARLDSPSNAFEVGVVERVYTLKYAIRLGIHLLLSRLSLEKTVFVLENFGVNRCKSSVQYWVKQAILDPQSGRSTEKIALDETVVKVDVNDNGCSPRSIQRPTKSVISDVIALDRTFQPSSFCRNYEKTHSIEAAECFVIGAP